MGMFDWVRLTIMCPECGSDVGGFQTKESECTLAYLKPEDVDCFYTGCSYCKIWIDVDKVDKKLRFSITPSSPEGYSGTSLYQIGPGALIIGKKTRLDKKPTEEDDGR